MGTTDKGSWSFVLEAANIPKTTIAVTPLTDTDDTIEVMIALLIDRNERLIFNVSTKEFNRMVDMLIQIRQSIMELE